MDFSRVSSTASKSTGAEIRPPLAAIGHQEIHQPPRLCRLDPVADRPALSLRHNQAGMGELAELLRQGVRADAKGRRDFPRRNAARCATHQQAEDRQSGRVGEGGEGVDSSEFHNS